MCFNNLLRIFSSEINSARMQKGASDASNVNTQDDVPVKFKSDVKTLTEKFGELIPGKKIVLSLQDALIYLPRDRKRVDAYAALQKYLTSRDVKLIVESQKSKRKNEI